MDIIITGGITVPRNTQLQKHLTYPNPFEPEEEFCGFLDNGDGTITVPRGTIKSLPTKVNVVSSPISIGIDSSFKLRDYQEKPVANIVSLLTGDYSECLLTAKTGSGKSFSLGFVIKEVGERTLILAHLSMLTTQMFDELSANLDADVRILDKSNQELGDINITTFQYLHSNPDFLETIAQHIGLVVVDEAENMLSSSRMAVWYRLKPKYQLLMTATPSRDLVGRTPMILELVQKSKHVLMEPIDQIIPQNIMFDYRHLRFIAPTNKMLYKGALTRFFMQSEIVTDTIDLIKELINYHGCVWIIVDSLKLQDHIMELLAKQGINSEVIRGATSAKERKRILQDISEKKCRVILGSAPLSAGISIPEFAFAFRLMPHSSSHELLTQQKGRLKRSADFKSFQRPLWMDYAIEGSLAWAGKRRFKFYKEQDDFIFGKLQDIKSKLKEIINNGEFSI